MSTTTDTTSILLKLSKDISDKTMDVLSDQTRGYIEDILQKKEFDNKERNKWINLLLKYWMGKVLIRISDILDPQQISIIEVTYRTQGQNGLNEYMKNLKNIDKRMYDDISEVFRQEFLASLKHFFNITLI